MTEAKTNAGVTVREVTAKRDLRRFVDYPNKLYRDVPQFVPAFYGDDMEDWNPKKNPAFSYCEAKCWLAWRDGEIVGRIGAILSHKANETWHTNRMRFTQVDFIDDPAVSDALFAAVEAFAKEKGCDQIHGPLGFCDLDREGMLVDGFDRRGQFITYYNHPYYNDHLTRLGYRKDTDWVEYKIIAPTPDSEQGVKLHRIAEHVMRRKNLHVADVTSQRQYKALLPAFFDLVNRAYAPLYGVVELNEQQIAKYSKKFAPLITPELAAFVMDENETMVGMGVAAPSVASAMQACRGHLFPVGWIGVLHALKTDKAADMFLTAVTPELQGIGVNAIILDHLIRGGYSRGITYAETGPQLETNSKILNQWKMFDKELHKRRRCYIKDI